MADLGLVLLGALLVVVLLGLLPGLRRERWEYHSCRPAPAQVEPTLDWLGNQGWELIDQDGGLYVFKRRRRFFE